MCLEWHLLLLGKPFTALFLTYFPRTHYWVYHTQHHHNLDKTLRRIYIFLEEHHEVVYWITFSGSLLFYSLYFFISLLSKCSLKLSHSSRIIPKCFCDEAVSTLLLLNVIERELSSLILFEK